MSTVSTVSTVIARCYLHLRWYFFNMGLTPPPLFKNVKKTAGLVKRYIPNPIQILTKTLIIKDITRGVRLWVSERFWQLLKSCVRRWGREPRCMWRSLGGDRFNHHLVQEARWYCSKLFNTVQTLLHYFSKLFKTVQRCSILFKLTSNTVQSYSILFKVV